MGIFDKLEIRRRELGISEAALAKRAGVSLPTVQRILSANHPQASYGNVMAIAEALGMELVPKEVAAADALREAQAKRKAVRLVKMVQGTSGLEGQAVDERRCAQMVRRSVHELLAGPARKLWAD